MQATLADLTMAVDLLTERAELLYPQVDQNMLGIQRRSVAGELVDNCYAAITVMVSTESDPVEFHVGLFVYSGVLLEGIADSQFRVVDPEGLDTSTIKLLIQRIHESCAGLNVLLEAATSPAA